MKRAVLLLAFAACAGAQVSGVVRDVVSKLPVEGAQVSLSGESAPTVETDARGAFQFADLPPGNYTLAVEKSGYTAGSHISVRVKADAACDPLTVDLYPFASISGRVLDEDGRPVAGAVVDAAPAALRRQRPVSSDTSGDDGRFRLSQLGALDVVIRLRIPAKLRDDGYPALEFYPGVTESEQAAVLTVAEGSHVTALDIRLRRAQLVTLRGHVVDLAGGSTPVVEVAIDSEPTLLNDAFARHPVDRQGRFHIDGVPAGRRMLQVYRGSGNEDLPYGIAVQAGKDEIAVPVPAFATIEGTVTNGGKPWEGVLGIAIGSPGSGSRTVVPADDGTFELRDVPPGDWPLRLQANNLSADGRTLRVASVQFGEINALDRPLHVTEGGNPRIVVRLSDESGTLAGTVEQDEPKNGRIVVVAQRSGGIVGPQNIVETQADGSFLFRDLLPGEYRVTAWALVPSGQGVRGADCRERAARVTVSHGETATVKLKRCDQ